MYSSFWDTTSWADIQRFYYCGEGGRLVNTEGQLAVPRLPDSYCKRQQAGYKPRPWKKKQEKCRKDWALKGEYEFNQRSFRVKRPCQASCLKCSLTQLIFAATWEFTVQILLNRTDFQSRDMRVLQWRMRARNGKSRCFIMQEEKDAGHCV